LFSFLFKIKSEESEMGMFVQATRKKVRLRMAIDGVSGSGKTYTALRFGTAMQMDIDPDRKIGFINTESGAAEKYLGLCPDGYPWDFHVCYLPNYSPTSYTAAIMAAGREGFQVLIIDSLSHAWAGVGGALEIKDAQGGNSFTAWKTVTPMHNRMIESILHSPCHIIATMRSKTEYVMELDANGKSVPRKIGMEPVQRAGMEYEFDIYGSVSSDHILKISKSRCPSPLIVDAVVMKPGADFIKPVIEWMNEGIELPPEAFAVTEEDLKKLEDAKRIQEQGSQVMTMSAEDLAEKQRRKERLKEAAKKAAEEKANAVPANAASTPAATTPTTSETSPVATESTPPTTEANVVASTPVNPVVTETTPVADPVVTEPPSTTKAEVRPGMCTVDQAVAIIELSKKIGIPDKDLLVRISELTTNKSQNILDLKTEVAAEVIVKLRAKLS